MQIVMLAAVLAAQLTGAADPRALLASLVGKWTVNVTYQLPNGRAMKGGSELDATWMLDQKFVRQEYRSPMGNQTLTIVQFVGYDGVRRRFDIVKMDNSDPAVLHTIGSLSADGRQLTTVGERADPATRQVHLLKTVTTFADADHFTVQWLQADDAGVERVTVTMAHARKKD
jgi:uncharacterized protein DUF1579